MNKKQKKAKTRAARENQRLLRLKKEESREEELSAEEIENDLDPVSVSEPENDGDDESTVEDPEDEELEVRKDYGSSDVAEAVGEMMGPVSWEEKDESDSAEMKANEIHMLSYNTQDLVRNILRHPSMEPDEKSDAIEAVGKGFKDRMNKVMSEDHMEDMKKDLELLQIEAIIAEDKRHNPVWEILKAKLSYGARESLSDSSFACVRNVGGKKERSYPIHDKAHVRNALARAAQGIKRGGDAATKARCAMPKIRSAAKRMGIEASMEKSHSTIMIEKDAQGNWRWIGWVSNNFKDRDNDIISKEAHQEYVDWLNRHPEFSPYFMSWHQPETVRKNRVDFWTFENGFLIMSGKLEEAEAAALLKAKAATDIGMSERGFGLRDEVDPRVIVKYRLFEVSDLPLENAANPFTAFETILKEVKMDKLAYLATIMGSKEEAEAFLKKSELKQDELRKAGVEEKEKKEVETKTEPKTEPKTETPQAPANLEEILKAVGDRFDIQGLNEFVAAAKDALEKVPVLEALIKEMSGKQEEKLADMITPPVSRFAWSKEKKASESKENVLEKDDKLASATPGVSEDYWLNIVTGTHPIEADKVSA